MAKKVSPQDSLSRRFSGEHGRSALADVLSRSSLFTLVKEIGEVIDKGEIVCVPTGKEIIHQDGEDNDIYIVISGKFDVIINGRVIATRTSISHVGEMALIDYTAKRSATVKACEDSIVLKISEKSFTELANCHPSIWRQIAIELARRLKERSKFIRTPRLVPVVFVASSSESVSIVTTIKSILAGDDVEIRPWNEDVFAPSKTPIEDLVSMLSSIDFGIVVMDGEDITRSRGRQRKSPRDNVIFELGLLIGAIGRERTFILSEDGFDYKIPSDLMGVNHLTYKKGGSRTLAKRLSPACTKIKKAIIELKPV